MCHLKRGLFPLDGGREKKKERMSRERECEVCARRAFAAVSGEAMAAGLLDGGQSF